MTIFLEILRNEHEKIWNRFEEAPGNEVVRIKSIKLVPQFLNGSNVIDVRTPLDIYFEFWNLKDKQRINLSFQLYNFKDDCIMNVDSSAKDLRKGFAQAS